MEIPQKERWFESAFDYLNTHTVNVSKENKLKFYGYFKQATTGDCTLPKPNLFEFVARAKWDAWNKLKGMAPEVAMEAYVELAESLDIGWTRLGEYDYVQKEEHQDEGESTGHILSSLAHQVDDDEPQDLIGFVKKNVLDKAREQVKEFKQDVNMKDEEGLTALHHASDRGYSDMIKLLIGLGADVNAITNDSETALHYACISEQTEAAQLLLDNGCDVTITNNEGQTAFDTVDSEFLTQLNYTK